MKKVKFLLTATIICSSIGVVIAQRNSVTPNYRADTWDTYTCSKDNGDGSTTYVARCVTPATDGPCVSYSACPSGFN